MPSYKIFFAGIILLVILLGVPAAVSVFNIPQHSPNLKSNTIVSNSIGTSTITLNETNLNIKSGGSSMISFTVKLASGTTWGTTISASGPTGFSTSFTPSSGDPTFSGTATVSVANSVKNGTYTISFTASGDDPTSSAAKLTVTVYGYSSSAPPTSTPPSTSSIGQTNSIYAGAAIILAFLLAAIVPLIAVKRQILALGYASFAISIVSALYLEIFDHSLYSSAIIHWFILLIFIILSLATLAFSLISRKETAIKFRYALGAGSMVMSIGMIIDAALGLPLSSVQNIGSTFGFAYLFGFGTGSSSIFGVSLAFSLMLVFNGLIFSSFVRKGSPN